MRHLSSQTPPPPLAKLNPVICINAEHRLNYVNLQNTASEQTRGCDVSCDKCSQATCLAYIYAPALSSRKSTLNIVIILDSQLSVTADTTLQIKNPEAKVC